MINSEISEKIWAGEETNIIISKKDSATDQLFEEWISELKHWLRQFNKSCDHQTIFFSEQVSKYRCNDLVLEISLVRLVLNEWRRSVCEKLDQIANSTNSPFEIKLKP